MTKWAGMSDDALIAAFRENARGCATHLFVSARKANAASNRIFEIVGELRARGSLEGTMSGLLDDHETEVRVWAARQCLEFAPQPAERILEELASGCGPVASEAVTVLMLLRTGGLQFS